MDQDETLRTLAERYRTLHREAENVRLALAEHIRRFADGGMRQVEIVKATGYTREQIRRIVASQT